MKLTYAFALTAVLGLGTSAAFLHAADKPDNTTPKVEKKTKAPRITGVYAKLDNLTDDQKTKIAAIHKETLEEIRKLNSKEEDDIKALLTDAQKTQLTTLKEEMSAKRKSKMAEKSSGKATTQPADGGM